MLLVVAAVGMAHYTQVWSAIPPPQQRTSDFAGTYTAATLWRGGQSSSMYDVAAEQQVMLASGAPANHLFIPFENPPLAAVVAAPLSVLDAGTAYRLWSLLQLALLIAAVVVAARAAPWPKPRVSWPNLAICGVAIAGFGTGLLFVEGQWDGVAALGIAIAYAGWRRGAAARPGFAIGFSAALAKPHLVIGVLAFMVGRRDWRGLAGAAAGALVVGIAGVISAGPGALSAFVRALLQPANSPTSQMQGASGIFGSLLGVGLVPYALSLSLGAVAVLAAGWLGTLTRHRTSVLEPAVLGAVALSLFASPHLLGHDLTLLAPVLVATLAWSMCREVTSATGWPGAVSLALLGGWAAINVASLFDLGHNSVGWPGRLTPWVLLAGCVVLLVAMRPSRGARTERLVASLSSPRLSARY